MIDFNDWQNGRGVQVSVTSKWEKRPERHMVYESTAPDETLENIIQGFYSCMIGMTWLPETVLIGMRDFVEEKLNGIFVLNETFVLDEDQSN